MHTVEVCEWPEAFFLALSSDVEHWLGIGASGIERNEWLASLAITYEFNCPKHSKSAHFTNRWVLCLEFFEFRTNYGCTDVLGIFHNFFFFKDVDRCNCRCTREWVSAVGEAARKLTILEGVCNFLADYNTTEW